MTKLDVARALYGPRTVDATRSGAISGEASVRYGTAQEDSTGEAPALRVRVLLDGAASACELACDAAISAGDRVKAVWRGGTWVVVSLAQTARAAQQARDEVARAQERIDAAESATEQVRKDAQAAKEGAEQAAKDAAAASGRAEELAGKITDVTTAVTEQGKRIDGAVKDAGDALKASTETSQTVTEIRSTADRALENSEASLSEASAASQTATELSQTVERDYQKKSDMSSYAAKSDLTQTADEIRAEVETRYQTKDGMSSYATDAELEVAKDSITQQVAGTYQAKADMAAYAKSADVKATTDAISSSVSAVTVKAETAYSKATTVEQTVDGIETRVTQAASVAGSSNLVLGFCAPLGSWRSIDSAWSHSGGWDHVGSASGWAWVDADNSSGTSTKWVYFCDVRQSVVPGAEYTLLAEFQAVTKTGAPKAYFGAQSEAVPSCFANSASFAPAAGASLARLSLTAGTAAQVRNAESCTRGILGLPAGAKFSGRVRFSLYLGDYDGPYLSPGSQATANELTTVIRATSAGVEVGRVVNGARSGPYALVSADGSFDVYGQGGGRLASFDVTGMTISDELVYVGSKYGGVSVSAKFDGITLSAYNSSDYSNSNCLIDIGRVVDGNKFAADIYLSNGSSARYGHCYGALADWVVARGTTSGVAWQKWASGRAELWGVVSGKADGNGTQVKMPVSLPFGCKYMNVALTYQGGTGYQTARAPFAEYGSSATAAASFNVYGYPSTGNSGTLYVAFQIRGAWK